MALSSQIVDICLSSTKNYIKYAIGEEVQEMFDPVLEAIDEGKYQRIAVKACHAVGKTFTFARIMKALMDTNIQIKLISTAPTFRQVHDLLWKEMHTAHNKTHPYFRKGKLNEVAYWVDSETFAEGFSPQKSARAETGQGTDSVFQGYHGKQMTVVIFDEATGVPPSIWDQAEGLLTSGGRVLFLTIANPTSRNCNFFGCFSDPSWKTFSITCFDSPNLKASNIHNVADIEEEADIIRQLRLKDNDEALDRLASYPTPFPFLINTRWVIEKAIEWGTDHPLFMGKVLGEFPLSDANSLVSLDDVIKSQERENSIENATVLFVGLDVARFGIDKSAATSIIEDTQIELEIMSKNDTNEVTGKTIVFIEKHLEKYPNIKEVRLAVDGGFGHGVIDRLKEIKTDQSDKRTFKIMLNVEILEIHFGASDWVKFHYGWVDEFEHKQKYDDRKVQEDRENFTNYKSKMFDLLARDIKNTLQLQNNAIYNKQLPKVIKCMDSKGRLKIESKEDYKDRTGETSPDETDSLALANFGKYYARKQINNAFEAFRNYE